MGIEWLNKGLKTIPTIAGDNKGLRESNNHDFGASLSLREKVSFPGFKHYFQRLDKEMYFKVVEKQILEAIEQFLGGA